MNTNKKYNKANGKKESRENGRNLCFHDWLIVRELKGLDEAYDERMRCFNYGILMLAGNEDSDERQKMYDDMLEERERIRAIYIQRRNELKAGFTGRQERQDREVSEKGWRKSRIERLSDISRSGYVLSGKETKAALNNIICDDLVDGLEDHVNMDSWHKYTPEELEEMGIVKGTLAKGRLHPDDVGKELTPEMLNRVIWERAEEDE